MMRLFLLSAVSCGLLLSIAASVVYASESESYSMALEYEAEKDKSAGIWSDSLTVIPGIRISNNSYLNKVELMFGYNQERSGSQVKSNSIGMRLRKDVEFNEVVKGFVRVAAGHTYISNGDYNWGYIEPGIEFSVSRVLGFGLSERLQNSIDSTHGQRVNMFRVGPNFDLNEYSELELRYISTSGDYESDTYMAEYIFRF